MVYFLVKNINMSTFPLIEAVETCGTFRLLCCSLDDVNSQDDICAVTAGIAVALWRCLSANLTLSQLYSLRKVFVCFYKQQTSRYRSLYQGCRQFET